MNLGYQTHPTLQAFPNYTNTVNKAFLLLFETQRKLNGHVFISRERIAQALGVSPTHVSRLTRQLQKDGLIKKTIKALDYKKRQCIYEITEHGKNCHPYIVQAYNLAKKVFLSISLLFSPDASNVTLVKLNGESIKNECMSVRELLTAREANHPSTMLQPVTKKETVMQIPDYVEKLTETLKLTLHGKIKLSIFNESTVQHGFAAVQKTVKCKDVYAEMVNQCTSFAKENGYPVNWKSYFDAVESKVIDKQQFCTTKKITSDMVKPRKSILESIPTFTGRSSQEDLIAMLRKKNQEKLAQRTPEQIRKEQQYLKNNPEWTAIGLNLGVDFNRFMTVDEPVTKIHDSPQSVTNHHDLESSKCIQPAMAKSIPSPISRCVVQEDRIMCLARQYGGTPQNMVEPEPVDYEQDSIWEEV